MHKSPSPISDVNSQFRWNRVNRQQESLHRVHTEDAHYSLRAQTLYLKWAHPRFVGSGRIEGRTSDPYDNGTTPTGCSFISESAFSNDVADLELTAHVRTSERGEPLHLRGEAGAPEPAE
jgi:hypothetical protein